MFDSFDMIVGMFRDVSLLCMVVVSVLCCVSMVMLFGCSGC